MSGAPDNICGEEQAYWEEIAERAELEKSRNNIRLLLWKQKYARYLYMKKIEDTFKDLGKGLNTFADTWYRSEWFKSRLKK